MISNVNGHGVTNLAGTHNAQVLQAAVQFQGPPPHQNSRLQVRPVNNPKMTAPTAWQSNQGGKLQVSSTPAKGGSNYNPQGRQPYLGASWTSGAPRLTK